MKYRLHEIIVSAVILIIGVPLNAAIIRIYTRKNSKVNKSGQREFPLMFAVIDLIALMSLPFDGIRASQTFGTAVYMALDLIFSFIFIFGINGYLFGLLMATVDKFYAVYFPFKYRITHGKIVKYGIVFVLSSGMILQLLFGTLISLFPLKITLFVSINTVIVVLVFVTVNVLFVLIVVKLVQNGKKLGRVAQKPIG